MSRSTELPDFMDKGLMYVLLEKHLVLTEEGFAYKSGWSDLLISQAINPNFKAHHAGTIRRSKFGKLVSPAEPTPLPPSRMDILEQRLSRVIDILATNSPRSAQHRRYLLDGSSSTAHLDDI